MKTIILVLLGLCSLNVCASERSELTIDHGVVFILNKTELSRFVEFLNKTKSVSGQVLGCTEGIEYAVSRNNIKIAATCVVHQKLGALQIENICSNEMVGTTDKQTIYFISGDSFSLLKFAKERCGG